MNYLELFVFINFSWGGLTLILLPFCERKRFEYTRSAIALLTISWIYLIACIPVFRDGVSMPEYLSTFYVVMAVILSVEVWIVMLLTLLAIGLAKQSHHPEYKSYMLRFHKPLHRLIKPLWYFIAISNLINSGYYFLIS